MTDYTRLKEAIAEVIRNNDRQEITGDLLQQELFDMIDAINETKQDNIDDLDAIRAGAAAGATAYQKPADGIPATDLDASVQTSLEKADTAYQLPSDGIPKTDLDAGVQDSLDKADTALQQHQSLADCVQVNAQTFTDSQKAQARTNIGAGTLSTPSGAPEHYMFENIGAIWNGTSWKIGEVSGLTSEDMRTIFRYYSAAQTAARNGGRSLYGISAKALPAIFFSSFAIDASDMFAKASKLQCVVLSYGLPSSGGYTVAATPRMFEGCAELVRVLGRLNMPNVTNTSNMFEGCSALEEVYLVALKTNVNMSSSPNLSPSSVAYMINNAGTATFTITLEAGAYAAAMADTAVQTALAAHTNVTLASA